MDRVRNISFIMQSKIHMYVPYNLLYEYKWGDAVIVTYYTFINLLCRSRVQLAFR